jgi:hypothetical protein
MMSCVSYYDVQLTLTRFEENIIDEACTSIDIFFFCDYSEVNLYVIKSVEVYLTLILSLFVITNLCNV